MLRARAIPCLLLEHERLVKTVRFKDPRYVGDILNAVRIFNDKGADELFVLDIGAHETGTIGWRLLEDLVTECFMPVCYGGGVRSIEDMRRLFRLGIEKVAINSALFDAGDLVERASAEFGRQAIVASVDVKRTLLGARAVVSHGARKKRGTDPVAHCVALERRGAGEIFLQSVDRDGTGTGFDLELIRAVTAAVSVPVVACGGAGRLEDLARAVREGGAAAAAAGSLFVFHGPHRAVLITYPERDVLDDLFH